ADDHAVFRRGLKETIGEAFPKVTFGEAKSAVEALESVRLQNWDIVILDISMPGKSGLDILDDLKRLRPKLPILLLSMHPEEQYARRALKAGASGYLTKESVPDELKLAVRKIVAGGRCVSATCGLDEERKLHFEATGIHDPRCPGAACEMWDEHRPRSFTLSYTRFLYSPDVFLHEFVIILFMGGRSSRRRKMRVFIADDSRVIVERLADLLKEVSGVQLVGNAGDVPGAIRS